VRPFLHRGPEGPVPRLRGYYDALRRPAALPAALRCLRLAVPHRSLAASLPRATSGKHPRIGASFLAERPTSAFPLRVRQDRPRSWGTPLCLCPVLRPRWVRSNQACTVRRHGPRSVHDEGSRIRSFGAQSHGFGTRCLRFAVMSYPMPTQDSLPAAGQALPGGFLSSAGFHRRVSELLPTSHPPFPSFRGARTGTYVRTSSSQKW
jgi:hypothetical protein